MTPVTEGDTFLSFAERVMAQNVPLHALYEITERCNYACTHCYLPHRGDDELSTGEAKAALDGLAEAGTLFLTLTGGEVFLRRDFLEIAEHARAREFVLRIFTNGYFVDEARADRLSALDPMGIEISLYGHDAESFETVTGIPGSFARTTAAIRRLTDRGVRVVAKTPIMRVNARRIEDVSALADSLGAAFRWDALIAPMDGGETTPLALRASNEDLAHVFNWARKKDGNAVAPPEPKPAHAAPCNAGRGSVAISPRGDVYTCVAIKTAAGNVRERPFPEIWSGTGGGILSKVRGITVGSLKSCVTCDDRPWCSRCAGMALHEEGSLTAPNLEACRVAAQRRAAYEGRPTPADAPARARSTALPIVF